MRTRTRAAALAIIGLLALPAGALAAAALRAKIIDPYPAGDPTYVSAMPQDFGSRMSATELDELVAFLVGTARR